MPIALVPFTTTPLPSFSRATDSATVRKAVPTPNEFAPNPAPPLREPVERATARLAVDEATVVAAAAPA